MLLLKKLNVVDCNVVRYNNKTYRVDDFDWDKRFDYFFKFRNDIIIIIVEYYKKVSCGVISFILFFCFIIVWKEDQVGLSMIILLFIKFVEL